MSIRVIKAAIPHREPFLLLDEIVEQTDSRIVCRKRFTGEEFWYAGHYPEFPLTPGVMLVRGGDAGGGGAARPVSRSTRRAACRWPRG